MKKFYTNATATWKDSSRRNGGFFTYSDVTKTDCLIMTEKDTAVIFSDAIAAGYIITDTKRISGKYFSFNGTEVTEQEFDAALEARQAEAQRLKAEWKDKQAAAEADWKAANDKKYAAVKAIADSIIVDEQWAKEKADAMTLSGPEKSRAFVAAFKGLLARNGKSEIPFFYQVMRMK